MKKLLALVLGGVLLLAAGCGTAASSGSSSGAAASGSAAKAKPTIGVAIYKFDDTFMTGVRDQIAKAATGKATVNIVDGQNSQPTQNDQIDLFLNKHMNALAINPVDPTAAGVIIDKAKAANTPVVFFNREPSASDMAKWDKVYYVGADAKQSGTYQGQMLADYWKAHPEMDKNHDGVMQIVILEGQPGNSDTIARTKYSVQAIEDAGIKVQVLAKDYGNWDRSTAQDKMAAFLGSQGDKIEAVDANNDDMALGAIEALKAKGYFQNGKYMPVVGVDATAPGQQALQDGTLLGTVLNDAKNQGIATLNLADVLAQGLTPSKANTGYDITDGHYVWVPYKKITKANISDAQ